MFLNNSRYAKTPQVQVTLPDGTRSAAVQLRPIPVTTGAATPITANDRLDVMAYRAYGDNTRSWHIADANSELDSRRLFAQWLDDDNNAPPLSITVPEA